MGRETPSFSAFGSSEFSFTQIQERAQTAHAQGFNPRQVLFHDIQRTSTSSSGSKRKVKTKPNALFRKQFHVDEALGTRKQTLIPLRQTPPSSIDATITLGTLYRPQSTLPEQPPPSATGTHLYTFPKLADMCFSATKTHKKTWQMLQQSTAHPDHVVRREDIIDLSTCFRSAMNHVSEVKTAAQQHTGTSVLDQDLMKTKTNVQKRLQEAMNQPEQDSVLEFSSASPSAGEIALASAHVHHLSLVMFEQKWCDLVFGEIEQHLLVSCLEHGHLIQNVRETYAKVFDRLNQLHDGVVKQLQNVMITNAKAHDRLQELEASHREADLRAQQKYQTLIQTIKDEAAQQKRECELDKQEAYEQVAKMNETMKSFNLFFKQMREDPDHCNLMQTKQTVSSLERKVEMYKEELDKLRPFVMENEQLKQRIQTQQQDLDQQKQELEYSMKQLEEKDAIIEQLVEQHQQLIQQEELRQQQQLEQQQENEKLQQEKLAQEQEQQAQELYCANCRAEFAQPDENAFQFTPAYTEESSKLGGKKRLQCTSYRILLPNLNGKRPIQDKLWTLGCIRAILHAKQIDDCIALRAGRPRIRFPEFVYAWYSPSAAKIANCQASEEKDNLFIQADELRWCLYYGSKLLSKTHLEAQVFYSLLDEKFGDDMLVFALYCLRILTHHTKGTIEYQHFVDAATFEQFRYQKDIPEIVYLELKDANLATSVVLNKASGEERDLFNQHLAAHAVPHPATKNANNPHMVVDLYRWLKLILQEYQEEQIHRRAAVRLMFQTAAAETSTGEEIKQAPGVDMEQFTAIISSLNNQILPDTIATLFRTASYFGKGHVTFDAFLESAEQLQFFASCLTFGTCFGQIPATLMATLDDSKLRQRQIASNVGATVAKHLTLFKPQLEQLMMSLPPGTKTACQQTIHALSYVVRHDGNGVVIDGIRALHVYRHLLYLFMQARMVKLEIDGEAIDHDFTFRVDKELANMQQTIIGKAQTNGQQALLDTVRRKISVHRLQRAFRARLARDQGVPLSMRCFMHNGYGSGKSSIRHRLAVRADSQWMLNHLRLLLIEHCRRYSSNSLSIGNFMPSSFSQFVYDYYLELYGARWESERMVHDLFVNIRATRKEMENQQHSPGNGICARVNLFCQLCGMGTQKDDSYFSCREAFGFLHKLLREIHQVAVTSEPTVLAYFTDFSTTAQPHCALKKDEALQFIRRVFPVSAVELDRLLTNFDTIVVGKDSIGIDQFLLFGMQSWRYCILKKMNQAQMACCTEAHLVEAIDNLTLDDYHQLIKVAQFKGIDRPEIISWGFRQAIVHASESSSGASTSQQTTTVASIIKSLFMLLSLQFNEIHDSVTDLAPRSMENEHFLLNITWEPYAPSIREVVEQIQHSASSTKSASPEEPGIAPEDLMLLEKYFHTFLVDYEQTNQLILQKDKSKLTRQTYQTLWKTFRQLIGFISRLRAISTKSQGPVPDTYDIQVSSNTTNA